MTRREFIAVPMAVLLVANELLCLASGAIAWTAGKLYAWSVR